MGIQEDSSGQNYYGMYVHGGLAQKRTGPNWRVVWHILVHAIEFKIAMRVAKRLPWTLWCLLDEPSK